MITKPHLGTIHTHSNFTRFQQHLLLLQLLRACVFRHPVSHVSRSIFVPSGKSISPTRTASARLFTAAWRMPPSQSSAAQSQCAARLPRSRQIVYQRPHSSVPLSRGGNGGGNGGERGDVQCPPPASASRSPVQTFQMYRTCWSKSSGHRRSPCGRRRRGAPDASRAAWRPRAGLPCTACDCDTGAGLGWGTAGLKPPTTLRIRLQAESCPFKLEMPRSW